MNSVSNLGCIVCLLFLEENTPCSPHHMDGKTKPGAHLKTIGLCSRHHQVSDTHKPKRWISRHGDGRKVFEHEYMTEAELLAESQAMINA